MLTPASYPTCSSVGNARHLKSRHPPHNNSSVHLTTTTEMRRTGRITDRMRGGWRNTTRLRTFIPDTGTHTPGMDLPRTVWVRLNRLHTGVGRFRSYLHKWGMVYSAACECDVEEQTVDHVFLAVESVQCWPPYGLCGLTILDDKTIEWLLNTCTEIQYGLVMN